jgi:hypothetical protein
VGREWEWGRERYVGRAGEIKEYSRERREKGIDIESKERVREWEERDTRGREKQLERVGESEKSGGDREIEREREREREIKMVRERGG